MKKLLVALGAVALLAITSYVFAVQKFMTLDKISVKDDSAVITLSGKTRYRAFRISNPSRLVVEFGNTEYNAKEKVIAGSGTIIRRIRGGQFKDQPVKIARIVFDLASAAEYEIAGSGGDVTVSFRRRDGNSGTVGTSVTAKSKKVASKDAAKTAAGGGAQAAATKKPVQPAARKNATEEKTKAAAPIPAAASAPAGNKPPDITVLTPVAPAANASQGEVSEVIAAPAVSPEKTTQPREAPVPGKMPEMKPAAIAAEKPSQAATTTPARVALPKKPVTLDFEDADIRDVLRILSMKSGINIIYGSDVSGTVSIRLENVPFDKAFETIMSLKNLVSQEQGPNILRVVTPQKISDERAQAVTFTKIFPLNYAKGDEVKANLDSIRNAEGRRGNISVDARTNSLIVTDTPEGLSSVEQIISELDRKPQQVIIEAKIVELVRTDNLDLGIQWQYSNTLINDPARKLYVGASKAETTNIAQGSEAAMNTTVVSPLPTTQGGTGVTFPATAVSGQMAGIAFGLVSDQMRLTGMINALAQKGLSRLLSTPRITTINNRQARILVGQKIPYTTTTITNSGTTQQTNFLDVGIKLNVVPTINKDKKITLEVHPEVSLFIRADPAGPVIGTREANTTVIVNNGETVVIGGLITDDDRKLGTQVPLLGDLPIIGHLFKRQYDTKDRTELLVFLTPQIIE